MRSLSKHVKDIVRDNWIINTDIVGFTKTQIIPSVSTCKITETLNFFNTFWINLMLIEYVYLVLKKHASYQLIAF